MLRGRFRVINQLKLPQKIDYDNEHVKALSDATMVAMKRRSRKASFIFVSFVSFGGFLVEQAAGTTLMPCSMYDNVMSVHVVVCIETHQHRSILCAMAAVHPEECYACRAATSKLASIDVDSNGGPMWFYRISREQVGL